MINEDNQGGDQFNSENAPSNKRKRITINRNNDKGSYNRSSDDSRDRKPLFSSDNTSRRPYNNDSRDNRGSGYDRGERGNSFNRTDRNDRSSTGGGYNRDNSRFNSNDRFNRDDRGNRDDRYNRDGNRDGNRDNRFNRDNRDGNRDGNRDDRFNRSSDRSSGYNRTQDGERRPSYDRGNGYDRNQSSDRRPFTKKPYGSDSSQQSGYKKPYNRDGRSDSRSYGQSSGRPGYNKPGYSRQGQRPAQRQPFYKPDEVDPNAPIRLNKFIANTGLCSRREADTYIETGLITVNGQLITELGSKVLPGDDVRYNGERLQPERKVYILLNKPKDYVTSVDDPHAKQTVMDLIEGSCHERIYPVGRLDRMTTGVLLLTNDGELTKKLTHPTSNIKKVYQVLLDKNIKPEDMRAITEGITLDDGFIKADNITFVNDIDNNIVGIEVHSGRNRIVRRIFEHFGYKVIKLDRVFFAGLTKKSLSRGKWRFLDPREVGFLKMMKA